MNKYGKRRADMKSITFAASLIVCLLILTDAKSAEAQGNGFSNGINFTHPLQLSRADQDAGLGRLKSANVKVVRIGFYATDIAEGVHFVQRAYAQGIRVLLTVHSVYPPDAPIRPYLPKEFPGMAQGQPLSSADPGLSGQYFQQLMDALDAHGITLAGIELENEINNPGFNAEFPLPGEGKNLSLEDLNHDPVGQKIAAGYLQYLKVLSVLKKIRDQSKSNAHTPLISAGLSDTGPEGPWSKKYDAASVMGTIRFLQANGIDRLVDAYGVHTYPWADSPGDRVAGIHRLRRVAEQDLSECRPEGSVNGKPCWITEWGFSNSGMSCPSDEKARSELIQEMRIYFRQMAQAKTLVGLAYYTWAGDRVWDVYRCGGLTASGRRALAP